MQLPAENLGQHPAGSEYAINASSGSPHNALNPRRFTPEKQCKIKNLRTDEKIPDGRAQRRVRKTLDPKQNWSFFLESVSSALT